MIDEAFPLHAKNQDAMLAMLSEDERQALAGLLGRVLMVWEADPETRGA